MALMSIHEYLDTYFTEESRPHINTIYNWIKKGDLPVERRGKKYFVDTKKVKRNTGSEYADKILNQ